MNAVSHAVLAADNPDAELLEMISSFRALRSVRHDEWSALNLLPKRHPEYKMRWANLSAAMERYSSMEKSIARTPALTLTGAIAKAKLGFDMLAGDDPQGDDLLHDDGGHCRMWAVATQGTRDLLRLVGERCGPDWDEPDAALIALCAQFNALEHRRRDACNAATTIEEDDAADLVWAEARKQQEPILEQICATPATTKEGMKALASSLTLWDQEIYFEEDDPNADTNERLQAALLRSVLAGRA